METSSSDRSVFGVRDVDNRFGKLRVIIRSNPTKLLIIVFMLLISPVGVIADKIEVIQLHNRSVDEVVPLVGPMIKPGEAISGTGYKLILRASPETVAQVRRVLSEIDTGLQNLIISVRHGDEIQAEQSEGALDAFYDSQKGGAISGRFKHNQIHDRSQLGQRVRVLEGSVAYIHTGKVFYTSPTHYPAQSDIVMQGTVRESVGSGFYVAPRLNGKQVSLEISPYRESLTGYGKTIDTQNASSVISGQLGEWIYIGGVNQTQQLSQQGVLSGARSDTKRQSGIYVKVDAVD